MVHQSNSAKKGGNMTNSEQRRLMSLMKIQNDEVTHHFFNKAGSCFNQLQAPATHTKRIMIRHSGQSDASLFATPVGEIERIFGITKRLLAKEIIEFVDQIAMNTYSSGDIVGFPYKSFGETVHLVLTSLIRELLQSTQGKSHRE